MDALGFAGFDPESVERALVAEADAGPASFGQRDGMVRDYGAIVRDVIDIVSGDESVTLGDLFRVVQANRHGQDKFVGDANDFADWFQENLEESVFDGAQGLSAVPSRSRGFFCRPRRTGATAPAASSARSTSPIVSRRI